MSIRWLQKKIYATHQLLIIARYNKLVRGGGGGCGGGGCAGMYFNGEWVYFIMILNNFSYIFPIANKINYIRLLFQRLMCGLSDFEEKMF